MRFMTRFTTLKTIPFSPPSFLTLPCFSSLCVSTPVCGAIVKKKKEKRRKKTSKNWHTMAHAFHDLFHNTEYHSISPPSFLTLPCFSSPRVSAPACGAIVKKKKKRKKGNQQTSAHTSTCIPQGLFFSMCERTSLLSHCNKQKHTHTKIATHQRTHSTTCVTTLKNIIPFSPPSFPTRALLCPPPLP